MEISNSCLCRLSRAARRDIVEIKKRQGSDERAADSISFRRRMLGSRKIIPKVTPKLRASPNFLMKHNSFYVR
jgi:hypothetical protein